MKLRQSLLLMGLINESAVGDWVRSRALSLEHTTAFATIPLPPGFPRRPPRGHYAEWLDRLAESVRRVGLEPPPKPTGPIFRYLHFVARDEWQEEMALWLVAEGDHERSEAPRAQRARVSPGDQLWELHLLSEQLSLRYGWSPAEATNFVLTGAPPLVAKGGAHVHRRSPFDALTRSGSSRPAHASVEVRDSTPEARAGVRPGGNQETTRSTSTRALHRRGRIACAEWLGMEAESRTWRDAAHEPTTKLGALAPDSAEPKAAWPQLQGKWNDAWRQTKPEWCYSDAQARQFSRDTRAAWKRVTGQPWWTPKTAEEREARRKRKPKGKRAS